MKKSRLLLVAVLFTVVHLSKAQTPNWLWARSAGGISYDYAQSVATDTLGNSYVAGYFNISIAFDQTHSYTSAGSTDLYLVKYDPAGNVVWATSAGGSGADVAASVAVDRNGNVYLAGHYVSPTLVFGNTTLTNAGGNTRDVFVVKYDAAGNVLWAKSFGGNKDDRALSMAVDTAGNGFITGYFVTSSMVFGTFTLTNSGGTDVFLTKLGPDGTVLWARSVISQGSDYAYGLAVDKSGNSLITGNINGYAATFGTVILQAVANMDVFIAKYNPDGTVLWADRAGVSGDNVASSVAVDKDGNSFITGYFKGNTLVFGSYTLTNAGAMDLFLVKYSPAGTVLWARSAGGTGQDAGNGVATDKDGFSYVTGYYKSPTITFGLNTFTNAGAGTADLFVSEYSPAGDLVWSKSAGGSGDDMPNSIATDTLRNSFVAGYFGSPTLVFGNTTLTMNGTTDMFLVKSENMQSNDIQETAEFTDFNCFPNPAADFLKLKLADPCEVTIMNLGGKVCSRFNHTGKETTLDIRNLPSGIYLIRAVSGTSVMSRKFVKN